MSVAADLATRVRLSDPKPAYCSGCWQGAEENIRFVDFDAAHEGGQLVEERDGVVMTRISGDDLHLCEQCVRAGAQALALKPDLHARQVREIKRLELAVEHYKDENARLRAIIGNGGPDGK